MPDIIQPGEEQTELNRKLAWEAFLSGKTRLDTRPFAASIEITQNCNFRCVMCAQASRRSSSPDPELDMKPSLFRKLAHELFPYLEMAHLQGFGESTYSSHWPEILDICASSPGRARFSLVTNLGVRDPGMWRKMVAADFRMIFSCDGATAGTFERIRRGGSFSAVIENAGLIQAARAEYGRGALEFLVTLQKGNYHEMPDFVGLARRFGATRLTFSSVRFLSPAAKLRTALSGGPAQVLEYLKSGLRAALKSRGRVAAGREDLSLSSLPLRELAELKLETVRRAAEAGLPLRFSDSFLDRLGAGAPPAAQRSAEDLPRDHRAGIPLSLRVSVYKKCFKPYSYAVINYKGEMGLCNHLVSEEKWERMGSLEETTLEEIWNSRSYQQARRSLASGRPCSGPCNWCFEHRLAD